MTNTAATQAETVQQKIAALLAKTGIPSKEIRVYGSQIMITTWSEDAARSFARVVARFAKVNRVMESTDDNVVNTNTVMRPSYHKVWRVWGTM